MSEETSNTSAVVDSSSSEINSEGIGSESPVITEDMSPAEIAHEIRKFKVKIDGQELEVDEDELLRGYQTTKSAQQKFNEASLLRKQSEEFIRLAKSDPRKLLTHPGIGIDLQEFANSILAEQYEEQLLSPEEKELRNLRNQLAEFENQKKEAEARAQQEELDKYTAMYEQEYTEKIIGALETSGLPKTEYTVKKIAEKMLIAAERGLDVEPADVIHFVKADYMNDIKTLFGAANEDILMQLLGDDITKKVLKGSMKKIKGKAPVTPTRITEPTKPITGKPQENKFLSREEWMAKIRENAK